MEPRLASYLFSYIYLFICAALFRFSPPFNLRLHLKLSKPFKRISGICISFCWQEKEKKIKQKSGGNFDRRRSRIMTRQERDGQRGKRKRRQMEVFAECLGFSTHFPSFFLYIFFIFVLLLREPSGNVNVYMYVKLIDDQFAFSIKSNGALFCADTISCRCHAPLFSSQLQYLLQLQLLLLLRCCRRQHTRKLPRFFFTSL